MGRSRYSFVPDDAVPYFVTATTIKWLPLFSKSEIGSMVIDGLRHLINNERIRLYAYVLMENHLHLIADSQNLSKEIGNFKSFVARTAIDYYKKNHNQYILDQLMIYKLPSKTDSQYQFWQVGSHPERINDEAMFEQKVNYIHNNPVKRGYIDLPEHWRYSSARNYAGMEGLLPVFGIDVVD